MAKEEIEQTVDEKTLEASPTEPVEEVKSKPKDKFHKTRKGGIIISILASLVMGAIILFYNGPAEPIVFGLIPLHAIGALSIVLSLIVTLIYKFFTDQILMKELKGELKSHQKQMKNHRGDTAKISELSKKSMETNMKYMRQTFKPMLITIVPFLLIFQYLRGAFDSTIILNLPFWPHTLGWIGTYIIFSMIFTTAFRKILDVV